MSDSPTEAALADAVSELRGNNVSYGANQRRQTEDSNEESAEGNNSDNSSGGLLSIGNNSFGFNFENESLGGRNSSGNSDGNNSDDRKSDSASFGNTLDTTKMAAPMTSSNRTTTGLSSLTTSSANNSSDSNTNDDQPNKNEAQESQNEVVSSSTGGSTDGVSLPKPKNVDENRKRKAADETKADANPTVPKDPTSHQANASFGNEDMGYSDSESFSNNNNQNDESNKGGRSKKKKRLDENKREERNQREKERSFRISKQITELRDLLSNGGVVVPKGTKSSVLTEAANYIRMLQQHQYRSEIDRHQLIQQMQLIGQGAHGPQAAQAIRHFAAQNGVWSLGNFGGVPPKSAMEFTQSSSTSSSPDAATSTTPSDSNVFQQNKVEPSEYRFIFNSCGVGMAIASMGGAFVDCNQLFCQLSNYDKQEVCGMTIFNMTDRSDLQRAFDQISQLISPPIDEISQRTDGGERTPVTIRASLKNRDDLGLCVSLVKGEDGVSKCFCVTLVKNATTPFETSQPIAASFDSVIASSPISTTDAAIKVSQPNSSPAFTSG